MTESASGQAATRYLEELSAALVDAPPSIREEIVAGVREELDAVDEQTATARIAELGDPRRIAAEALAESPKPAPKHSMAYPIFSVILLVVGGYIVPFLGWIAALIMIGLSPGWSRPERTKAIVWSAGVTVVCAATFLILRSVAPSTLGGVILLAVPLFVNVACGSYLIQRWRARN